MTELFNDWPKEGDKVFINLSGGRYKAKVLSIPYKGQVEIELEGHENLSRIIVPLRLVLRQPKNFV